MSKRSVDSAQLELALAGPKRPKCLFNSVALIMMYGTCFR
jgi:hypothetical protein